MSIEKIVNVGVVGCGYWGPNLIRNLRSIPSYNLKVICDKNQERLAHIKGLYPEVDAVRDSKLLMNDPDLDAIFIATPVQFHYELAKQSLLSGKHTFIEKPMASNVEQCNELIDIANAKKLTLMVGHTFLYSPSVRQIKQIIDSGEIGPVQYISARRLNLGLFQHDINVLWDLAPHDISIIMYFLGQTPIAVNCNGHSSVTEGIEDVTYLESANARRSSSLYS